jgi:hypothetical protein
MTELLTDIISYIDPQLPDAFADAAASGIAPTDPFFEELCNQHTVEPLELAALLTPPAAPRDPRAVALELAALLVQQLARQRS